MTTCAKPGVPKEFCTCVECQKPATMTTPTSAEAVERAAAHLANHTLSINFDDAEAFAAMLRALLAERDAANDRVRRLEDALRRFYFGTYYADSPDEHDHAIEVMPELASSDAMEKANG